MARRSSFADLTSAIDPGKDISGWQDFDNGAKIRVELGAIDDPIAGDEMMLSYKEDELDPEPILDKDSSTNGDVFGG